MDINEFIEIFIEIFDDTDLSAIKPDTKFRDLNEWSSLSVLALISLTESEFAVKLKPEEIKNADTITDIFQIIREKQ